jgi:hypothetical protein
MIWFVNTFFFLHENCDRFFERKENVVIHFLVSVFGILTADRILYRLEIFKYISSSNRRTILVLSLIFYILISVFKDLLVLNISLFGILFAFLIFFYIFHEKKLEILFENRHKVTIDELILIIQAGNSPIKAVNDVFQAMTIYEKKVFSPLKALIEPTISSKTPSDLRFHQKYFHELTEILCQKSRVTDQLEAFRNNLNIQIKLRRRSRAVATSIRAQAIVSGFIYLVFLWISWTQFALQQYPVVLFCSALLFLAGMGFIFKVGNKIKWTI